MINLTRIYIAVAVLLLSLLGCEKLIYDETTEDTSGSNPKVYLSVTTRAAQTNSSLRSSINTDADFEDHVYNLAMVIFENGSDNIVGEPYFNSNLRSGEATYAFTVEMDPGKYDFYFIANVSELEDDIENITDRTNLDKLMNSILTLDADLYTGASYTK